MHFRCFVKSSNKLKTKKTERHLPETISGNVPKQFREFSALFDISNFEISGSVCKFALQCARHDTSFHSIVVQVSTLIWLVALAFPQRDQSGGIGDDVIIFNNDDGAESSSIAPSSTTPNSIAPSSTTQGTTNCPCLTTAEYNPVCGTDNVTYWNMGRFNCAKNCNPGRY